MKPMAKVPFIFLCAFLASTACLAVTKTDVSQAKPENFKTTPAFISQRDAALARVSRGQSVDNAFVSKWFPGNPLASTTPIIQTRMVNGDIIETAFAKNPSGAWTKHERTAKPSEPSGLFSKELILAAQGKSFGSQSYESPGIFSITPNGAPFKSKP